MLVVAPSSWRDACFSLPATRALAATRPVTVLCPASQQPLWEAVGLAGVATHDGSARGIASALPDLPQALLWEDGAAAKACARSAIAHRTGLPAPGLAKRLTHPLERTVRPGPPEHRVRRYLDTVALLDAEPLDPRWFEPLPAEPGKSGLLIAPDSDFGSHHEWPVDRWLAVLEALQPDPATTRLAPGPLAGQLAGASGIKIAELPDPVAGARFERLIGADASQPHIAGAFGTTCAVLYGPGDPAMVRPLGQRHVAIRRKVECSPCFADRCPLDGRCQDELEVGRVEEALSRFLRT